MGATYNKLYINTLGIFRVVKTTTLISVKYLIHSHLQVTLHVDRMTTQGIIRCRPKNSEAVAMRSGAPEGLMCPVEKGVRGIET